MKLRYFTRSPDEIVFTFNISEFKSMFKSECYLRCCADYMRYCGELYEAKLITIECRNSDHEIIAIKSIKLKEE